jgi:hypothetical protein
MVSVKAAACSEPNRRFSATIIPVRPGLTVQDRAAAVHLLHGRTTSAQAAMLTSNFFETHIAGLAVVRADGGQDIDGKVWLSWVNVWHVHYI